MPPHDDEIRIPLTVNTAIGETFPNLTYAATTNTTADIGTTRTYTDVYTPTPFETRVWTTNEINVNTRNFHNDLYLDTDYLGQKVRISLERVLDDYFRKIYKVIAEHARIDISEDEFMKLIKEENDE